MEGDRLEYWRGEICEAVGKSAKHGVTDHIDFVINSLVSEVLKDLRLNNDKYSKSLDKIALEDYKYLLELLKDKNKKLEYLVFSTWCSGYNFNNNIDVDITTQWLASDVHKEIKIIKGEK